MALPADFLIAATVSVTPSVLSKQMMLAPSPANSFDVARPMPLPAPVTMAPRPSRRFMVVSLIFLSSYCHGQQKRAIQTMKSYSAHGRALAGWLGQAGP